MRYIKFIGENKNKYGDTHTVFRLRLFENEKAVEVVNLPIVVNIANDDGYVMSAYPNSSQKLNNDDTSVINDELTIITLDFNESPLQKLTPGPYKLEV